MKQEANDRYFAEMMRKRHTQIFWQDSCQAPDSYYFDKNGDVPLRPASTLETYWRSRRFPLDDYEFSGVRRASSSLRCESRSPGDSNVEVDGVRIGYRPTARGSGR